MKPSCLALTAASFSLLLCGLAGAAPATAEEYGVTTFDGEVLDSGGSAFTQAGGHPFTASATIEFTRKQNVFFQVPVEDTKELSVDLPPGFVGNPGATPKCTTQQLNETLRCPDSTQVGTTIIRGGPPGTSVSPVFNMETDADTPAVFAFPVFGVVVRLEGGVRSDGDYGLTVDAKNIPQTIPLVDTELTFWGVPADPAHDTERGYDPNPDFDPPVPCYKGGLQGAPCSNPAGVPPKPFLTNPTSCTAPGVGLETRLTTISYPGDTVRSSFFSHLTAPNEDVQAGPDGCDRVPFDASLKAAPSSTEAGAPTGFAFDLDTPQSDNPTGLANAHLKSAKVTLPRGVTVSPSAAGGLASCTPAQVGLKSLADASCPEASKVGTVSVDTPLLDEPLTGGIYLGAQRDNPFGTLLSLYIVAKGPGVIVKLPGRVDPDPVTGQLVATFDNNPQLPFERLRLAFNDGPRAPLNNPERCGNYTTESELTSWNGKTVRSSSQFAITQSCDGGGFDPGFSAGTLNPAAGAFSPFVLRVAREDRQQVVNGLSLKLPTGSLARLRGVPLCPEARAAAGTCDRSSRVGSATIGAGPGANPFFLQNQPVYLTGPYKGAPYGLVVAARVVAGPFDLGTVVVRQAVRVDPTTAQLTVDSDPLPTILEGIPLQIRKINVDVDRPGFTLNPTSCAAKQVEGTIRSPFGASARKSSRFQAANCAALPLKPTLNLALTGGKGYLTDGKHPGLKAILTQPRGQSNLKKVEVKLPLSLALDPDNAQGLCEFKDSLLVDPKCPKSSIVGRASATTPVLNKKLTAPVYFAKNVRVNKFGRQVKTLPTLVIPLRGENGLKLNLIANSAVSGGKLVNTFKAVPDAPVSRFDLKINGGKNGILVANSSVCARSRKADVNIDGHNGKPADTTPTIRASCAKAKKTSSKKKSSKSSKKSRR